MQLVAYGAQDVYLTGNPQITLFKGVYKRHTNFSTEPIAQSFTGSASFGKNCEVPINRNADLVTRMYLRASFSLTSPTNTHTHPWSWVKNPGHVMIKNVELQIGGQKVDKHLSQWLEVWHELSGDDDHGAAYDTMIGNGANTKLHIEPNATGHEECGKTTVFVPLYFWFNRHVGSALPLIALQYHEVKVKFEFEKSANMIVTGSTGGVTGTATISDADLIVDYVYLDTEERKRFAQLSHEYLIEQVQDESKSVTADSTSTKVDLHFNHPCKALYWVNSLDWGSTSNYYLGNDLESATKSFIIRYCMKAYTDNNNSGGFYTFMVNSKNEVLVRHQNTENENENGSSSLSDGADMKGTGTILNHLYVNFNKLVSVITSATVRADDATAVGVALKSNLWDSIHTPVLLDGQTASMRIITTPATAGLDLEQTGPGTSTPFTSKPSTIRLEKSTKFTLGGSQILSRYIDGSGQTITDGKLKLNGQDRFDTREANYFNKVQPWQSHQNSPVDGVYVYSFALNPNDHQPSGSCNFSRIDNSTLELTVPTNMGATTINVYTVNYNVLRIMSGMGGLAYSN